MRSLFVIICILALGLRETRTSRTHEIQQITNHAGLYYEPLHEVHFTRTEWRLTTFKDLKPFETHQPTFAEVPVMEHICKPYLDDRCKALINKESLLSKNTLIDKYFAYIRKQKGIEPTTKRSVPFGFIGTMSKTLFGTLTTDDATYFNDEIDKLYKTQRKMAIITKDQTHIVRSQLHDITERLNKIEKLHNEQWSDMANTFQNTSDTITFTQNLMEWRNSIGNIADTYISNLRAIVEAIQFIKLGLLHPELLNPATLELIVKSLIESHHRYLFPISLDEIHSGALSKISRLAASYHDKKIIIAMHIPLLEPTKFIIYKLHPLPVSQHFGDNDQGAAYVQPRASHIIISKDMDKYALVSENDLPRCQHLHKYQICSPNYPIYEVSSHRNCELLLLTDGSQQSYENCEIKVIKKQASYWKQLDTMSGWLFSLPYPEIIQILCDSEEATVIELRNIGILKLRPGCIAKTQYVTISGTQTLEGTIKEIYVAEANLDLNQLIPNISQYKPLQVTERQSRIPISNTKLPVGTPKFDTSLREIEEKLLEASAQERERQRQGTYTMAAIYGEILLAAGLLTYILRGSLFSCGYAMIKGCQTPPDEDDNTYERAEEPTQTINHENLYDVPSHRAGQIPIREVSIQTTV